MIVRMLGLTLISVLITTCGLNDAEREHFKLQESENFNYFFSLFTSDNNFRNTRVEKRLTRSPLFQKFEIEANNIGVAFSEKLPWPKNIVSHIYFYKFSNGDKGQQRCVEFEFRKDEGIWRLVNIRTIKINPEAEINQMIDFTFSYLANANFRDGALLESATYEGTEVDGESFNLKINHSKETKINLIKNFKTGDNFYFISLNPLEINKVNTKGITLFYFSSGYDTNSVLYYFEKKSRWGLAKILDYGM